MPFERTRTRFRRRAVGVAKVVVKLVLGTLNGVGLLALGFLWFLRFSDSLVGEPDEVGILVLFGGFALLVAIVELPIAAIAVKVKWAQPWWWWLGVPTFVLLATMISLCGVDFARL